MTVSRLVSVLFVPGNREEMFGKTTRVSVDALCLDLEDSVPPSEKTVARALIARFLDTAEHDGRLMFVRVNSSRTGWLEADLDAVVSRRLDGICLPKAKSVEDIQRLDYYLTLLESMRDLQPGSMAIVPLIESAQGVLNCEKIIAASPRVRICSFGAEDFATDLGIPRDRTSTQIESARAKIAVACRAGGVIPIDTPLADYQELDWLAEDSRRSRLLGFEGRFCIHPIQVPIVNDVYRPTASELESARAVVEAYDDALRQGRGAIGLNGTLVDEPIVERARRLLKRGDIR